MQIKILYRAEYVYAKPVTFSSHLFRLFPRSESHVHVQSVLFETNQSATVNYLSDIFDNNIASCFYPESSTKLTVNLDLELNVEQNNAFDFLIDSHARALPFDYLPSEMRMLTPYLANAQRIELPFWKTPAQDSSTLDTLLELNAAIHKNLDYQRRDEGVALQPTELLANGAGSCRDFAVLLTETLRGLGVATRLASGYLCEFGEDNKVAVGAMHAWTEAYLPGAGWIGFDPTNGTLCDHHHLTSAVGLNAEDITPVLGDFYNNEHTPAKMNTSLSIKLLS